MLLSICKGCDMNDDNPYAVTPGSLEGYPVHDREATTGEVSARTIDILNQTRPWVRLMSILLWIGTVLVGFACVFMLGAGLLSLNPLLLFLTLIYVVGGVVYGVLAKALTTYASKIFDLNASGRVLDLEDALEAQKGFWKVIGIFTVVGIIIYFIVVAFMLSGVFMAGNFRPR
jgi:hypothetical protein